MPPRTLAVKRARGVDAAAAAAQAGGAVALVDVHANLGTVQDTVEKGIFLLLSFGSTEPSELVACHIANIVAAFFLIFAKMISSTEGHFTRENHHPERLNAHLHERRDLESLIALAGEAPRDVDAGPVAADPGQDAALVDVHAADAVLV